MSSKKKEKKKKQQDDYNELLEGYTPSEYQSFSQKKLNKIIKKVNGGKLTEVNRSTYIMTLKYLLASNLNMIPKFEEQVEMQGKGQFYMLNFNRMVIEIINTLNALEKDDSPDRLLNSVIIPIIEEMSKAYITELNAIKNDINKTKYNNIFINAIENLKDYANEYLKKAKQDVTDFYEN